MSGSWPPSYGGKPAAAFLDYAYSFASEIAANEPTDTISVATVAIDPADGSLGASAVADAAGVVTFWLAGGIPGTTYALPVTARMTSGRVLVSEPAPVVVVT
ncbi:MAG: hypothetical protein ACREFU_18865 [Acetobacteraceae bacterium]